jgi:hypothetical protein
LRGGKVRAATLAKGCYAACAFSVRAIASVRTRIAPARATGPPLEARRRTLPAASSISHAPASCAEAVSVRASSATTLRVSFPIKASNASASRRMSWIATGASGGATGRTVLGLNIDCDPTLPLDICEPFRPILRGTCLTKTLVPIDRSTPSGATHATLCRGNIL